MRAILLLLLAACGRFGFEQHASVIADAPPGDGSGDAPGDASGDGGVRAACGTLAVLADDFSGSTNSAHWYTYANGSITTVQTGGQLVITLPATTPSNSQYGGYVSSWFYDMRGTRVYVEVPQVVSTATNAQTDIQLVGVNNDSVSITEENGSLTAGYWVGTTQTNIATVTYDAVQQRWWAFREAQGTVYFETSPDGATFTSFATLPTPAYAGNVNLVLESGSFQTETNAGAGRFDNLNGGTATATFCPGSKLQDNFNAGTIDERWGGSYTSGACTYSESGGAIAIALATSGSQDCAVVSSTGYDVVGDAVFTELAMAPSATGQTFAYLRLSTPGGDNVELTTVGGSLDCAQNIGGTYTAVASVAYDSTAHRYFKLAESGGMLIWEASPDGSAWSVLHMQASPIPLTEVNIAIGAGTNTSTASPGTAQFGTLNQLPP